MVPNPLDSAVANTAILSHVDSLGHLKIPYVASCDGDLQVRF